MNHHSSQYYIHTSSKHSTTGRTSSLLLGEIKSQGYRSCDVRVICDLSFAAATAAAFSSGDMYGINGRTKKLSGTRIWARCLLGGSSTL
jgi:hypothetical protein